jgi:hypothetical protein
LLEYPASEAFDPAAQAGVSILVTPSRRLNLPRNPAIPRGIEDKGWQRHRRAFQTHQVTLLLPMRELFQWFVGEESHSRGCDMVYGLCANPLDLRPAA